MIKTMEIFPVFAIAGTVIGTDNNERFAAGFGGKCSVIRRYGRRYSVARQHRSQRYRRGRALNVKWLG